MRLPEHIAVSKSKGIKIDWQDGHHSEYELRYLRDNCPCATCAGAHRSEALPARVLPPFRMYKPTLKIAGLEPVGNYAVQIRWSDGHNSGIYSFDHLRSICQCSKCKTG